MKIGVTAAQAGALARQAGAKRMTVFHHSPRYLDQPCRLDAEAQRSFRGD